jgi:hypothetical protein
MQFVIKASKRDWIGVTGWIAFVGRNGLRAVGTREQAQVFTSRDEAARAIETLSPHFAASGLRSSVRPQESSLREQTSNRATTRGNFQIPIPTRQLGNFSSKQSCIQPFETD